MERERVQGVPAPRGAAEAAGALGYAAVAVLGGVLWWRSASQPAAMPFWMPWDFSWPEYLATALALLWFARGLAAAPEAARPAVWRCIAFVIGVVAIYAVLQTRYDYWAQHMFFLHRIQHVVMHHVGPFLLALGGAGAMIRRGMPRWAQRAIDSPAVAGAMRVLQQPLVAALLFVGLIYFWLIPPVHFRAMLDGRLYAVMNWSMVLDGLLFWCLVLDPRPKPPARISWGARAALAVGVMFPQIALGSLPLLRAVRSAVPGDQRHRGPAYRRHRHLDPAGDDERGRAAAGDQRIPAA
jgi:putative membrane protein